MTGLIMQHTSGISYCAITGSDSFFMFFRCETEDNNKWVYYPLNTMNNDSITQQGVPVMPLKLNMRKKGALT